MLNKNRTSNTMQTRTGKVRLGPLNLSQLQDLLEKSGSRKEKHRVRNRIAQLEKRAR